MKELYKSAISNWLPAFLLAIVFWLLSYSAIAGFDYNSNCQEAHLEMLELRITTARDILTQEAMLHPENGYVHYLQHFTDIIELIVVDDKGLYDLLMKAYPERFEEMDKVADGTPMNEILQAEMLFYVGLAQLKFGSPVSGAAKIYNSYRQVSSQVEKYPGFDLNLKMAGIYNVVMDFIPAQVRWISSILGIEGDKEIGMDQLDEYYSYVKETPGRAQEAVILIGLAYKLTWQDEAGLAFLTAQPGTLTENTLAIYTWALSATFCYQNDLAIEKLRQVRSKKTEVPFYSVDYIYGRCLLNKLDEGANVPLLKYLEEYPGMDFKKDACNRLSYYYLLKGEKDKYREYKQMVSRVGHDLRERDQEALLESQSETIPHSGLLKARLLFDGGYLSQADSVMNAIPVASLLVLPYRLEYHYRVGRIYQMRGQDEAAIGSLQMTTYAGAGQPYTFAARAALQLATIFEKRGDIAEALHWYERCKEYYDSAHTVPDVEDRAEKGRKRMQAMK